MKRITALAAFLALFAFSGSLLAQEMGEDGEEGTPDKKTESTKPEAEDTEPERPNRRGERGNRADRQAYFRLGAILRDLDIDGNRKVSGEELGNEELMTELDADEDGFLTIQEMMKDADGVIEAAEARKAKIAKEEFTILDRDDNGKLNKEELGDDWGGLLETGDSDSDGELSLEEFNAAREKKAEEERAEQRRGGGRGGIMERVDTDGDGKISKEEAPGRLKENFDDIDKDGDGYITQDELNDAVRGMGRGQRGQRGNRRGNNQPEGEDKPEEDKPSGDGMGEEEDDF